jgi:hypothetical protein
MGMQIGPDDKLYFTYTKGNRAVVGRIDPQVCRDNGGCSADEVEVVLVTELTAPLAGLTFSPDGRMFIHERYGHILYWTQLFTP